MIGKANKGIAQYFNKQIENLSDYAATLDPDSLDTLAYRAEMKRQRDYFLSVPASDAITDHERWVDLVSSRTWTPTEQASILDQGNKELQDKCEAELIERVLLRRAQVKANAAIEEYARSSAFPHFCQPDFSICL